MTNYQEFQQHINNLFSLESEESEKHEGKEFAAEKTIANLADQLHYLAQLEQGVTAKRFQIIGGLNLLQGRLKAKEVALHRKHKDLKMQDKMTQDKQEQKKLEQQMKELGTTIRQIDDLIRNIQTIEEGLVSSAKQEISTHSFIAKKAENKNDPRLKGNGHF